MDELSAGAPLTISVTDTASGAVIKADGELDASNIDRLRSAVETKLAGHPDVLMFDFSGITFMDTTAIALLIQAGKRGTSVRILTPSVQVRTDIEMTGLSGILVMEP